MKSEITLEQIYEECKNNLERNKRKLKVLESPECIQANKAEAKERSELNIEYYGLLAKTLEKQIAKKPRITNTKFGNLRFCSDCGFNLLSASKCCPNCGTKLDWGKE